MSFHNRLGDIEAEAGAVGFFGFHVIGTEKFLKHPTLLGGWDAKARIFDRERYLSFWAGVTSNYYNTAFFRIFNGVTQ